MIRLFASRASRLLFGIWVVILVTSLSGLNMVPVASHHPSGTSSSLTLVLLNSTDTVPHYGQQITFTVTTAATTEPHVSLKCSQSGAVVYTTTTGYYASYPWPWTQTMTLSSYAWTGGAADCTATLYYFSGKRTITLLTMSVPVAA